MKNLFLFLLGVSLTVLISCNNIHHTGNSASKHSDTTIIKCVKLGIKVIDEKGNNCNNFQAKYYINEGSTIFDWKNTPIDTFVHSTTIWSIFRIKGKGVEEQKILTTGIDRDTTLIFVLQTCK